MKPQLNTLIGLAGAFALALSLGQRALPSPAAALTLSAGQSTPFAPAGSAFTFQGQLRKNGAPVSGICSASFALFDALTGGGQIGATVVSSTLQITGGLFAIVLDYGEDAFNGNGRWIETTVGCGEAPVALAPRTALHPAPYALFARRAADADSVSMPYYPMPRPQTLDLAAIDSALKGFRGSFTDGRYLYLVPYNNGSIFGKIARIDLNNFAAGGVTTLDLTIVDSALKGFLHGFTDGRYGYFVPYATAAGVYSGKVARLDLQNFSAGGVTTLNLAAIDAELVGFNGGFTDGRYAYFVPYARADGSFAGKMVRVDLLDFSATGVTVVDLTSVDPLLKGFGGGFTDGRYGYLAPYATSGGVYSGKAARIDLRNFVTQTVTVLDLAAVNAALKGFNGGFTDGRFAYFVPYTNGSYHGNVVRVDLRDFSATGVSVLNLAALDAGLVGFGCGFTDNRYAYFAGHLNGSYFGQLVRVDLQNFSLDGTVSADLAATDANLKGILSAVSDGRYAYLIPYYNGSYQGRVARIQLFNGNNAR